MKKSYYLCLILFLVFQIVTPVFAQRIHTKTELRLAKQQLEKIERYLDEGLLDEAEKAWQEAYRHVLLTRDDKTRYKPEVLEELRRQRDEIMEQLRRFRELIDYENMKIKISNNDAEGAMEYLRNTLSSPFYADVDTYYIGKSYFETGKLFEAKNDFEHARICFLKALEFYEQSSRGWRSSPQMIELAKSSLRELRVALFQLNIHEGNYIEALRILNSILQTEKEFYSENSEYYTKYKRIRDNFPKHVLEDYYKTHTPQESFELFVKLLEGEYGERLTVEEKTQYYADAAAFFEQNSHPELVEECEKKQLEICEATLNGKRLTRTEREMVLKQYNELLAKNLEKAEEAEDYETVFEYRKRYLEQHKQEFGETDPRVLQECQDDMYYFFNVGDKKSARYFFDWYVEVREQEKQKSVPDRNDLYPYFFFMNDLSDYAQRYSTRKDDLYEPKRQEMEKDRRTSCAPQGNADKEFVFWERYSQFIQKIDESGDDVRSLAESLFNLIQDPVFQQYEYYKPILTLGTYYHKRKKYTEATFCANLSEDIVSFYSAPDSPENFYPILLRAAVLKDSGNTERAKAEVQRLVTCGILQRMLRFLLMEGNNDDVVLNAWPFGPLSENMHSKCLFLINKADSVPDSVFSKKIENFQAGTNPIRIIIKLANQYEKAEQFTQAQLLYEFTEQFFEDIPECMETLRERINMLEEKRKKSR